jgi:hypothetical protein
MCIMIFPCFRKLSNSRVFYKINSDIEFEELTFIGSKVKHNLISAIQYPELLKIKDMLSLNTASYLLSSKNEWESYLNDRPK